MLWWDLRNLKSKSPTRRSEAVLKVGSYDSPVAFKNLLELRNDPDQAVREAVNQSLNAFTPELRLAAAQMAENNWKDVLIYLLNDKSPGVQRAALQSLQKIGWSPSTMREKVLVAAEEKQWEEVKQFRQQAIGPLIDSLNARFSNDWILMDNAQPLLKLAGALVVVPLISSLKNPVESKRWEIIDALRNLRDDRAIEILVDLLKTESFGVFEKYKEQKTKEIAAQALGEIGDPRAIDALSNAGDVDYGMNIKALGKIDRSQAATKLIELTRNGSSVALESLVQTKDERAEDVLLEELQNSKSKLRKEAASGLGTLKSTKAIKALISLIEDPDDELRTQAINALGYIGDPNTIDSLVEALKGELQKNRDCYYLGAALARAGGETALDKLALLFEEKDVQKRFLLGRALVSFPGDRAMEVRNRLQPKMDGLVILFTSDFEPKEKFIDSILGKMQTHLRAYRNWMGTKTPIKVAIHPDAQNSATFTSMGTVEFRRMIGDRFDLDAMEFAMFEGSQGIRGVILSHWS